MTLKRHKALYTYDEEAGAYYFYFNNQNKVDLTVPVKVIHAAIDYDIDGNMIGLEVILQDDK